MYIHLALYLILLLETNGNRLSRELGKSSLDDF